MGVFGKKMLFFRYKHIFTVLLMFFLLSFISVYHYMTSWPDDIEEKSGEAVITPGVSKLVNPESRIYVTEKYELCEKYLGSCKYSTLLEGAARKELNNLTESELSARYPQASGWDLIWEDEKLILEHVNPGLCPDHRKRWHISPDEQGLHIAVYLGPKEVGTEAGLVRATDLEISRMPFQVQERIREGSLEYLDWEEVIATLDSFAEYQD